MLAVVSAAGCSTSTISSGPLAEIWYYTQSSSVEWKGSVDNIDFELNGRTETASQQILMSALVRGSKLYDYFVEVASDSAGNVTQCAVTRASGGSMSNYLGALKKVANAIPPKDAKVFNCVGDYSDRKIHDVQLVDVGTAVRFRIQLIR